MPQSQIITTEIKNDIAWLTINNPPVNAASRDMRAGLVEAIKQAQSARVAVLIGAGRTFTAGGDLTEFDHAPQEPHLPDVVQMLENSKTPFIAALHGTVLGGGFEIAMGCAWRIAKTGTRFGLPEVNVGIIPGAGGTQRLPRLIGMKAAIDMACGGQMISAEKLLELGGLDAITDDLHRFVQEFANNLPPQPTPISQRNVAVLPAPELDALKAEIQKRSKGWQAPLDAFEALGWASLPFAQGQPKERAKHLAMRNTAESRALRHAFFAERSVAKPNAIIGATPREISHIAIVGGGLMGAGIAVSCLNAGLQVSMIERDTAAADAGQIRVADILDAAVKRGKVTADQAATRLGNFNASADYTTASRADLAIEAVFEDLSTKQSVFKALADVMQPDAILATNTSYLDPAQIFKDIKNPCRCLGLHFFSPAHIMKLLEIIALPQTSPDVLATGFALGKRLQKTAVLSGICDGFIGNRMLASYRRAADYLLADGALPSQIDAAMREFGMPMGPYELQDLTGLQIAWANRKRLAATRPVGERYIPFGDTLCEQGHFGQRSGQGWYIYRDNSRTPQPNPMVDKMIMAYSAQQGIQRRKFTNADIISQLMAVLANEGALIVQQGIAEDFAAIDTVKIAGYGFPRWRGGPMQYAREIGWETTRKTMQKIADQSPNSWQLADLEGLK
ncbi:MAG: 3-hydroxyacyl-CoA dehydrogenase NAD-binding domain-containing protein [Rhodobacteraceae bacterium]|nr:3-hydroxyacyl-CoA dehydrogenase NAD-binding domain-containing protein [Paracoccaceae bacterium]